MQGSVLGAVLRSRFSQAVAGPSGRGQVRATAAITRDIRVVHEDCDIKCRREAGRQRRRQAGCLDVSGANGCQAVDLNFDGKVDSWTYFDSSGQVRRRERDYDRDGRVEEISIYQGGVLAEQQRSTTLADRIDTWQYYKAGKLAKTERDSDGDAVVDQWWEFSGDTDKCPMIHSDVDGDGKPDPGATIDYCKQTGYVPPTRSGPATTKHTFERPGRAA